MSLSYADLQDAEVTAKLDAWLRFDPKVAELYERETGNARVESVRASVYVGLSFYDLLVFASIAFLPDVLRLSMLLRFGLITPVALGLCWAFRWMNARWRETMMLIGMIFAVSAPIFLFAASHAPMRSNGLFDLATSLVFANMVMPLRYREAVIFTGYTFAAAVAAIALGFDAAPAPSLGLIVQIFTACGLTLYANHRAEARRCNDYLTALQARRRSDAAETAAETMRDLVDADPLTGLPNRRCLNRALDEWFAERRAVAVMMIDVDHFKLYNDALGHPAGDDCLRLLAGALAEFAANRDALAARFGGEEFVLAARGVDPLSAARMAAALVKTFEQLAIPHPGRLDGVKVVTASVGLALRPAGAAMSAEAALKRADEALYEAKRRGRDRYVFADPQRAGLIARA